MCASVRNAHCRIPGRSQIFSEELRFATNQVGDNTECRVVSDGLGHKQGEQKHGTTHR